MNQPVPRNSSLGNRRERNQGARKSWLKSDSEAMTSVPLNETVVDIKQVILGCKGEGGRFVMYLVGDKNKDKG